MKLPNCKRPCKDCPFRKDSLRAWLGKKRITEILNCDSFTCHKNNSLQCAGFMLIKNEESMFVSLAKKLKLNLILSGNELIFKTKKECINHHSKL